MRFTTRQQNKIFMGKQVHAQRILTVASSHGSKILEVPKQAFIFDVLFQVKHPLPPRFYQGSTASLGVPGNKDWIAKATDVSEGGVVRAVLGPGAGFQREDAHIYLYWNYSGQGNPSSGEMFILVCYELS